jgi:MSHA biogenesis protein MshO
MHLPAHSRGFSLVEMIVAIVVMSIMAVGLVQFIVDSSRGYTLTASRNQVSSAARVVIDRIAMDLHNALPESVRFSTPKGSTVPNQYYAGDQCLEFIPVTAATTYLNPTFRPAAANSNPFQVVNFVPMPASPTGHYAVIYPTSSADLYKDMFTDTEAIVAVTVADANGTDGKNEVDPVTTHRFKHQSSVDRLFLTGQPISYCITGRKLYRYKDYGFHTMPLEPVYDDGMGTCPSAPCLPATTGTGRVLITDSLDNAGLQAFDYLAPSRRRNAVIQLDLNFSLDGQEVRLTHEVMQQSTP